MQKPPPVSPPSKKKDRFGRWGLAVANQLALPGLGTVMAGRKIGYVQLLFSVSGFILTTAFLIWALPNIGDWIPPSSDENVVIANFEKWKTWFIVAATGIALFFVGWCMALFSSRSIVRNHQQTEPSKH